MRGSKRCWCLIVTLGVLLAVSTACSPALATPGDDRGRNHIARLNSNGSLDTSFNPGSGANYVVGPIVVQPDGKVLIGGGFTRMNGVSRNGIARLNSDGSLDTSFDPGSGISDDSDWPEPWLSAVALQPDGKVLIGGNFTHVNGMSRNGIARLNSDGSLDQSFNASARHGAPASIVVQPDGKVLIGGVFTEVNGVSRNRIARLNGDGSLDTSFDPGSGASFTVLSVVLQDDGRVLIGGFFGEVNGMSRNSIARLNGDGSVDTSFDPGAGPSDPTVWTGVSSVALQSDGKVLIGGSFTQVNGMNRSGIARLNGDGSLDESFNSAANGSGGVESIAVQPDGKVLIGGWFTQVGP
jgi:uncharacterized delta-60 repeat protein